MKIAIISDIHGNYSALKACIDSLGSEIDEVIFLGDLLTYGCQVHECIDTLVEFSNRKKITFIKGNHDQIYFDAQGGHSYEYKPFPDFIKESVEYTLNKLDSNLSSCFDWKESYSLKFLYFAHANASSYGDWHYINSNKRILDVARSINSRGFRGGFFGHIHRDDIYTVFEDTIDRMRRREYFNSRSKSILVGCVGSVGQPRGGGSSYYLVDLSDCELSVEKVMINYSVRCHIESIVKSNMSEATKLRLCSYFEEVK